MWSAGTCRALFHMKSLSVEFAEKFLLDLIRRGVWDFMTRFCEQLFTTLNIVERCGMLLKIDCLLGKYFEDNFEFYQEFTFAPLPLHFNKIKERGFDQAFLIARQVARALKLPLEGGLLRRVKAVALLVGNHKQK